MERKVFRIKFWGVRGSYPAPSPETVRHGGNTSCVEVQVAGHRILLDAGTGLIPMGREYLQRHSGGKGETFLILLSHHHFDHIQGFPFFRPAFRPPHKVLLYGPAFNGESVRHVFDRLMVSPMCPFDMRHMPAVAEVKDLHPGQRMAWDVGKPGPRFLRKGEKADAGKSVLIEPYVDYKIHPRDGIILYRITHKNRSVVYCTDMEGVHDDVIAFAKGTDLMIFDAMYTDEEYAHPSFPTKGWGHSTSSMAVEIARRAGVKKMALFHHNPDHDDRKVASKTAAIRKKFPRAFASREGMVVNI